MQGASRFAGGSDKFTDLLTSVIESAGGEVHTNEGVEWVEINNRHVDYVRTKKGNTYQADYYISAIHPCSLLRLMHEIASQKPIERGLTVFRIVILLSRFISS